MTDRTTRVLDSGALRDDVRAAHEAGDGTLARLVTAALDGEATADLVDYDDLIGFGMFCGTECPGLDREAMGWAECKSSERRLDVLCGFLTGYWMESEARDALEPELLDRLLALRESVTLAADSATGSVVVAEAGLASRSVSPEHRARLASRLLELVEAEPQYRHDGAVRLRLERILRQGR